MSLKAQVANAVEQAFNIAADYVSLGQYVVRTGAGTYDPVTDQLTGGQQVLTSVRMLRSSIETEEREASALTVTDVKVIVPGVDLQGLEPSETDWFSLDGKRYNVASFKPVPGNAVWIIYGREQ